jgi:hypothetical protein
LIYRLIDNGAVLRLLEDLRRTDIGQPDLAAIAAAPLLENYKAAIGPAYALSGIVSGHPRLLDGREIVTSQLFYLDPELGLAPHHESLVSAGQPRSTRETLM